MRGTTATILGMLLLHWWVVDVILALTTNWTEIFWFSSIVYLLTGIALVTKNHYLFSMQLITAIPLEGLYVLDFAVYLVSGHFPFGFSAYLADPVIPFLDLYVGIGHFILFGVLIAGMFSVRFCPRAVWGGACQIVAVNLVAYLFSPINENINCVFRLCGSYSFSAGPPLSHVFLWTGFLILFLVLPSTLLLSYRENYR